MTQRPHHHATLQLKWPFGLVLCQTIIILVSIFIGGEMLVHNESVQDALPPPLVNGEPQLGVKLLAMDRLVARYGRPGCILIGNSMVWRGISPDTLGQLYEARSQQPFWCFNFGIRGMDVVAASRLATILVQQYHPRLLIYGIHFRDFVPFGNSLDIPWTGYYLGSPSIEGWFEAHFYLPWYATTLSTFVAQGELPEIVQTATFSVNGFDPRTRVVKSIANGKTEHNPKDPFLVAYAEFSKSYQIEPEMTDALRQIIQLDSPDVRVIMVEMPQAPGTYEALPNGGQAHQRFLAAVQQGVNGSDVVFIQAQDALTVIPNNGWSDLFHLNVTGAESFTAWLGEKSMALLQPR